MCPCRMNCAHRALIDLLELSELAGWMTLNWEVCFHSISNAVWLWMGIEIRGLRLELDLFSKGSTKQPKYTPNNNKNQTTPPRPTTKKTPKQANKNTNQPPQAPPANKGCQGSRAQSRGWCGFELHPQQHLLHSSSAQLRSCWPALPGGAPLLLQTCFGELHTLPVLLQAL